MKSVNIKDPEAHRLATAISRFTGESLTRVVTQALRDRLESLDNQETQASTEELHALARRVSAQVKGPYVDHAEYLYDENGLPK